MGAQWLTSKAGISTFTDKYGTRYVEPLTYRVTAFIYFANTASCSDTICFWYQDFATAADAITAARNWCLRRCPLEREPQVSDPPVRLAEGRYRHPDPQIERVNW